MKDFKKLEEIWAAYVYEAAWTLRAAAVAECWKKCRDAGMDPNGGGQEGGRRRVPVPSARPTARS